MTTIRQAELRGIKVAIADELERKDVTTGPLEKYAVSLTTTDTGFRATLVESADELEDCRVLRTVEFSSTDSVAKVACALDPLTRDLDGNPVILDR